MKNQFPHPTQKMQVPASMQPMNKEQMEKTSGGKHRQGAFADRLAFGITASLIFGPVGFLVALF